MKEDDESAWINFLHETEMLAKTPRSGFAFLGAGSQSVAEHSFNMALTGYALAKLSKQPIDLHKLTMMCLLHDLPEARTGDLNHVNKKYVRADESKALQDIRKSYPCGEEVAAWVEEYIEGTSLEACIAHDADQLELMLVLMQEYQRGHQQALAWFENCLKRVKTPAGRRLAERIRHTPADAWWHNILHP